MSDTPFTINRGDTSPSLVWQITSPIETLVGSTVVFNMKSQRGTVIVERAVARFAEMTGELPALIYDWTAADTATAGSYSGEFEVTYADDRIETFPNGSNISIRIPQDIA
jgi:hypothetical protein